ncbi:MtrB/PioB family decaheme-associated outer membrane protein [Marinobacter sp. TBZ242]|uniref:MtrB/PioB family decaheme-associated outer membrane protein n=1 Tax=Marinobacter azerbaijanicus TaxID=3050455 RepID=A0ABT7IAW1_9GAMM|nr:MtrB/PioB family decaheme-associated outer membrane protein [Marinobacter sp. TBZ242]MDL0431290.1 MtrB/PioB family decaheme-associated outer membrane protein [Marinobacter sp. TBZ242]
MLTLKSQWILPFGIALAISPGGVMAETDGTTEECESCAFDWEPRGYVEAGILWLEDDEPEFTDYRGFDRDGFFLNGAIDVIDRNEDGAYWSLEGRNLGLGSRNAAVRAGKQGTVDYFLEYQEWEHHLYDSAKTVFSGAGTERLTLPGGWTRGDTTKDLTDLDIALRNIDIELERKTLSTGLQFFQGERWDYNFEYTADERDGTRLTGGSFLLRSAILPEPVDDITHRFDLSVGYLANLWQLRLAYHGSFFDNDNQSLTWDNPFIVPGDTPRGRSAAAPDNSFNRLMLSGAFRPTRWLNGSGHIAVGRLEQDDSFIPATINPDIGPVGLPRQNLDAKVNTLNARLRLTGNATRRLTLNAEGFFDERDNDTPVDSYRQVDTDLFVAELRENRPYSFEKSGGELSADYRLTNNTDVSTGYGIERSEFTFQEVDATDTDLYFGELRTRPGERVELRLRLGWEDRDIDGSYDPLAVAPPENPLLRKFNLADRDRREIRISGNYYASEQLSFGLNSVYADDDYHNSLIGLTNAVDRMVTLDASWSPGQNLNAYVYFSRQNIVSDIAGSESFGRPDWFAMHDDTINTLGGGVQARELIPHLELGIDLAYTRSRGNISVDSRASDQRFPQLEADRISTRIYGEYSVSDRWSYRLDYWLEHYQQQDFFNDGVAPDTTDNVLTAGLQSPDYVIHAAGISARYRF